MRRILVMSFILLVVLLMTKPILCVGAESSNSTVFDLKPEGPVWLNLNLYDNLKNYIRNIKEEAFSSENQVNTVKPDEMVMVFVIDLILSGFCLWLSMWILFKSAKLALRAYLWFILIINLTWAIMLVFFKGGWKAINFLVISQGPELEPAILDKFSYLMFITAVIIFIWLMARSFNLHFFGTLEAFFVSQALYFFLVFIISVSSGTLGAGTSKVVRESLGLRQSLRTYFSEIHSVTYGKNLFNLQRMRVYHL